MAQDALRIALIQGSIRPARFNDTITAWTHRGLLNAGFDVVRIDPAASRWLALQTGDEAVAKELRGVLATMDGFVIVTPEYNHAAPGALKTLIDSASREWTLRPVGFVSYGGLSGGLRAIESLRPVFAELHAIGLRDTISFAMPWERFDKDARLRDPDEARTSDQALQIFADRLAWWAESLRQARFRSDFPKQARIAA